MKLPNVSHHAHERELQQRPHRAKAKGPTMSNPVEELVAPTAIERALGIYQHLQQRDCTLMKSIARSVSVLLVEDEARIRMMVADMIEELGHTVVAEADNIADASNIAKSADFSIAILDINLGGDRIDSVAEIIDCRGLPFVFASGYGAKGLPEKFCDRPVLQKPFLTQQLEKAIDAALGGAASI